MCFLSAHDISDWDFIGLVAITCQGLGWVVYIRKIENWDELTLINRGKILQFHQNHIFEKVGEDIHKVQIMLLANKREKNIVQAVIEDLIHFSHSKMTRP